MKLFVQLFCKLYVIM